MQPLTEAIRRPWRNPIFWLTFLLAMPTSGEAQTVTRDQVLAGAAGTISAGITALDDEAGDHAMKREAVVEAFVGELRDARDRFRRCDRFGSDRSTGHSL